jgi:hypothetical protein
MHLTTIFDATNPLVVSIEPDANGVWQIQPSATETVKGTGPHHGDKHRDIVSGRAGDMKNVVKPHWTNRRAAGAPVNPTFFAGDHVPIVLTPTEQVKFVCGFPFTIWVDQDPNVSIAQALPGQPPSLQNPMQMTRPVDVSVNVAGVYSSAAFTVQATCQIFYKCTAYVDLGNGQTIVIDPDTIIDF